MTCADDGTFGATTSPWHFENWSRTRAHDVATGARPTRVSHLVAAVVAAEQAGGVVRAIGSGWSYPDAAIAAEVTFAIETDLLDRVLTGTDVTSTATVLPFALSDAVRPEARHYVHVEAGIKIHALNLALDQLGLALPTLGGSNGQSLAGAISTGTHGSDVDLRPIADIVRAIHLVGPGGQEWWIERAGARAITEPARLAQARGAGLLCADLRIVYDDLLFDAALVSVGRMGIVYAYVVEVCDRFRLKRELRMTSTWSVVAPLIRTTVRDAVAPATGYLEIVVNPFRDAAGDHACIVTRMHPTAEPLTAAGVPDAAWFEAFCNLTTINAILDAVALTVPALVVAAEATALAGLAPLLLIPDGGIAYTLASTAAITAATAGLTALEAAILAARSASGQDLAQKVVSIVNIAVGFGRTEIVPALAALLLSNQRNPSAPSMVGESFRMLTGQQTPLVPPPACLRQVNGLELALDCRPGCEDLFGFLTSLFALTEEFLTVKRRPPALGLSLRFTRGTEALIGMQQFARTCSIELIMLRGMAGEAEFLQRVYAIAKQHRAIPHWGLIHEVDATEVERLYGERLLDWRLALGRLIDLGGGHERTFRTGFSTARGLEPAYLAALVIADNVGAALTTWTPAPRVEATRTATEVYLRNRSVRAIAVTAVAISTTADGPGAPVFAVKVAVPFVVGAHQWFALDLDFVARTPGPLSGTVSITCDNPHAPIVSVPLATSVTPLGAHAELLLAPAAIDLGLHRVGTTASRSLSLTNVGSYEAELTAVIELVQPAGQLAIGQVTIVNGRFRLAPGATDTLSVLYVPTVPGPVHAIVRVEVDSRTDAGASYRYHHRHDVPLAAAAYLPVLALAAAPRTVVVMPTRPIGGPLRPPLSPPRLPARELQTLDFGAAPPLTTVGASLWLRNDGDGPLAVSALNLSVLDGTFAINQTFPAVVPAGGELEVPCTFTAGTIPGWRHSCSLEVVSDDPHRPIVVLAATGVAAGPHLLEPRGVFDLGDLTPPAVATLTFQSDGTVPVTIRKITLRTGSMAVSGAPALPASVAPGSALTLTITSASRQPGQYDDTLTVIHNGTGTTATAATMPLRWHVQ